MSNPTAKPAAQPSHDPWLYFTYERLEHHTGLAHTTIARLVSTGAFPPPDISIGQKIRLWRRATVANWTPANELEGAGK